MSDMKIKAIILHDEVLEAERELKRRFPGAEIELLLKSELKKRPLFQSLKEVLFQPSDRFIVFSRDFESQLRPLLLKALCALGRGEERTLIDAKGRSMPAPGRVWLLFVGLPFLTLSILSDYLLVGISYLVLGPMLLMLKAREKKTVVEKR